MRLRVALAALALLGCGRLRRRHAARREVDPRVANATACVDPRYFASSAVSLPTRGTVRDVAVAGGRGARRVAWVDDDGAHRWDFAAEHLLRPEAGDLCAWLASPVVRCGSEREARGGGRVAVLDARGPAGARNLFALVRSRAGAFEPQQLTANFDDATSRAVVWDGGAFGAAWSEPVHGAAPRGYFALIDRDGRRVGSAMRVRVADEVGLSRVRLAWAGTDYLLAALRSDGAVELRESGPRGCDEPLLPQPPAVPPARR
ncbi:MAG: hypothetical protein R3A48_03840 [Polyangiales bacterium]